MSYNGQPPYPPPGNLPPFRPNFAPGGPPPPGLPPFPPKGFVPPPFPPKYPPGSLPPQNGGGGPGSPGVRPPGFPPHPGHPGLGMPPPGSGLPMPPHHAARRGSGPASPVPRKDVKTTKIFVGSIAPGIKDQTMKDLLNACGPLYEWKRVEGAGGKPQAFAFASFENPEVVLRCIRCLNGVELPDMTPEGLRDRKRKPLVVKADQKTAEFLQEFEETLGRTDSDENADAACRKSIAHIVALLTDPNAHRSDQRLNRSGGLSPIQVVVPAHLQDLKEGDLPEEQRVAVLDQIAIFRENAARREREKKKVDTDRDRYPAQAQSRPTPSSDYGYGTRAFAPPAADNRPADRSRDAPPTGSGRHDPQGYSQPVPFVRPETAEGKGDGERTDEEEEAVRRQRREREQALALRDRESRIEGRERQRIDTALREESIRQQRVDDEAKSKLSLTERLDDWDDDEEEERGRELFYVDRVQWRLQRQQQRLREEEDDVEDRKQEDAEVKALEAESEDFLQRQMAEMASLEAKQRQAGLLTEDAAPIKLAIAANVAPEPKEEKPSAPVAPRPAIALGDDDEDDSGGQKKRRQFVKLEYEPIAAGVEDAEELARRTAQLLVISKQLPSSRRSVFNSDVNWKALQDEHAHAKIQSFITQKITDVLGELDQDLADFVLDHIAEKKGPHDLVDDLSPVLAEEAEGFVLQLWRQLLFEGKASSQGVDSGTMTV